MLLTDIARQQKQSKKIRQGRKEAETLAHSSKSTPVRLVATFNVGINFVLKKRVF